MTSPKIVRILAYSGNFAACAPGHHDWSNACEQKTIGMYVLFGGEQESQVCSRCMATRVVVLEVPGVDPHYDAVRHG
jgi:hypothetical protein